MPRSHHSGRSRPQRWKPMVAGVALLGLLPGCATLWEDVTSKDFEVRQLFTREDPLVVLRDSKDGDRRARAYGALKEPARSGGSMREQDFVLELLGTAVKSEAHFFPRLVAVEKLSEFKDARAVAALVEAYYAAGSYSAENATVLRCHVLKGLGQVGHPSGADLLIKVLRQGPVEGPEEDRRRAIDERIAAARALRNFPQVRAGEALVHTMKTEKDVALRDSAHRSLQICTGKRLPQDVQAWDDFLAQEKTRGDTLAGGTKKGLTDILLTGFFGED